MALVDERLKPTASWEIDADIAVLTHSTTIQPRYQAVIHCEIIRQGEGGRGGGRRGEGSGESGKHAASGRGGGATRPASTAI